ncbi:MULTISPECIES: hypothetical protein [Methylobacterium]|uniref:hypothetical protein n=1 Tax=Methylobacterium TaxID=407 RepID=UPI001AEA9C29|nr:MULTISPECIES: hypothetical protein [unclassified Methylobacterium]MBP2494937.1 hypothetical protein [Methylobacterium sp. PvP105]MBP2505192.1 hypothetical protein [Methylobacterium sp. PvP109]
MAAPNPVTPTAEKIGSNPRRTPWNLLASSRTPAQSFFQVAPCLDVSSPTPFSPFWSLVSGPVN